MENFICLEIPLCFSWQTLIIIYLFIKKPYTTVLQTKWFMIANDLKGGADNKSNLQPKAS